MTTSVDAVRYVGDGKVDKPIIAHREGRVALVASHCATCGDTRYPPRELCPNDLSPCEQIELKGLGAVYEAVRVELPPPGFPGPYWIGYVDLDEGVRVFAPIDMGDAAPKHADRVVLDFRVVRSEPVPIIGPVFTIA
jgi:uncharacterized OB-fold protein